MILGENLKKFRKEKGLTQEQFADLLNIKRATYATYETGRVGIDIELLQKISKHFSISLDKLIEYLEQVLPESAQSDEALSALKKLETNLDTLQKDIQTHHAAVEARQEMMLKLLVELTHNDYTKILDTIYNAEVEKMLEYKKKGSLPKNDNPGNN